MENEAKFIPGDLFIDDRGALISCNDFQFAGVKRAYFISGMAWLPRAWHGHKQEDKFLWSITGTFVVQVVQPNEWDNPSKDLSVQRFVLSCMKPGVLHIPAGNFHGFVPITNSSILAVFSTATLEESKNDDFRFPSHQWGASGWTVQAR